MPHRPPATATRGGIAGAVQLHTAGTLAGQRQHHQRPVSPRATTPRKGPLAQDVQLRPMIACTAAEMRWRLTANDTPSAAEVPTMPHQPPATAARGGIAGAVQLHTAGTLATDERAVGQPTEAAGGQRGANTPSLTAHVDVISPRTDGVAAVSGPSGGRERQSLGDARASRGDHGGVTVGHSLADVREAHAAGEERRDSPQRGQRLEVPPSRMLPAAPPPRRAPPAADTA